MALKQTIKYSSPNSYFAGFLQNIVDQSGITADIDQSDSAVTILYDESDRGALKKFGDLCATKLPHSIFVGDIHTEVVSNMPSGKSFESDDYDIGLCATCLQELSDPSSPSYLDSSIRCSHYSNKAKKNFDKNIAFSANYTDGSAILLCDIKKLTELFNIAENELKVLLSIEKPTMKVTIKDEDLIKTTGAKFINVTLPFDARSALVAINAQESGLDYLFFDKEPSLFAVAIKDHLSIIRSSRVATPLEIYANDKILNRLINICKEAGFNKGVLGAYLSTRSGISFVEKNSHESRVILSINSFDLKKIFEEFNSDENRKKLQENFKTKFPEIYQKLKDGNFGFFETISVIIGVKTPGFEGLSDKALEFRGNGGLKIDANFTKDTFDYGSFIGSIMSFKLADVEDKFLAYSVFEAIADMAISVLIQLKNKRGIDDFVMMGDMFANSVLYSRILSKMQQHDPYFSKSFALDE